MSRARSRHLEHHRTERISWLRAAVLGANDGIISTASLMIGVASASTARAGVLLSGVAGLVAGAMSMAAGEYVSVSSQADSERADLARERKELATSPRSEHEELAQIYVGRGLDFELAHRVAEELMAHDALGSHARDELGITETGAARPVQAALASACMFSAGAALPLSLVALAPFDHAVLVLYGSSLVFLIALGILAAWAGGANPMRGALRVAFWGAIAMGATALAGKLFGTVAG